MMEIAVSPPRGCSLRAAAAARGPERQSAKPENDFRSESGETDASGSWIHLKQPRRLSVRRGRGDGDDDEDDFGG